MNNGKKERQQQFGRIKSTIGRLKSETRGDRASFRRSQSIKRPHESNRGRRGRTSRPSRQNARIGSRQHAPSVRTPERTNLRMYQEIVKEHYSNYQPLSNKQYKTLKNKIRQGVPFANMNHIEKGATDVRQGFDQYGEYVEVVFHYLLGAIRIFLTDVSAPFYSDLTVEGDILLTIPNNPLYWINSLGQRYATMFQQYKIIDQCAHWKSLCAADTNGGLMMAWTNDPYQVPTAEDFPRLQEMYTMDHVEECVAWENMSVPFGPGSHEEPKYIESSDIDRWDAYGNFYVLAAGQFLALGSETSRTIGHVTMSNVVRFYKPKLQNLPQREPNKNDEVQTGLSLSALFGPSNEGSPVIFDFNFPTSNYFPVETNQMAICYLNSPWNLTPVVNGTLIFKDSYGDFVCNQGNVIYLRRILDNVYGFRSPSDNTIDQALVYGTDYVSATVDIGWKYSLQFFTFST